MPNYYIQATRGHFNPLSFDELVKPLNMYKEYYDENEKAVTEMRSQADLWDEIMKSEGNTDLANKYNQYSQDLNDAAQQLSNGMSYNLRKQIQDLRAKSAMVKQIENAYTLRAKDIDAYNELMMKDPSRIGAFNPSQRRLQEYMQGPVTNEYGVSGDRLYTLGNARAKAMSAQNVNYYNSIMTNGGQYFMDLKTQGFSDEDIAKMLREQNSALYNEASKIMQQEGATFDNQADMDRAVGYTINGMLSGFSYDEDRKYMKNENYMNKMDMANLESKILDNSIKELEFNKKFKDLTGLNTSDFYDFFTDDKIGMFSMDLQKDVEKSNAFDIIQKLYDVGKNKENFLINVDDELVNKNIEEVRQYGDEIKKDIQRYNELEKSTNVKDAAQALQSPLISDDVRERDNLRAKLKDKIDKYNKAEEDLNKIKQVYSLIDISQVGGSTLKEKIDNLYKFYNETAQIKLQSVNSYNKNTDRKALQEVLKSRFESDTSLSLLDKDGKLIKDKEVSNLIGSGNFSARPSNKGFAIIDNKTQEQYIVASSSNDDVRNYNKDIIALNSFIKNPIDLTNGKFVHDQDKYGMSYLEAANGIDWNQLGDSNISYALYRDKDGILYARIKNNTTGFSDDLKMYDVNSWNYLIQKQMKAEADKVLLQSID